MIVHFENFIMARTHNVNYFFISDEINYIFYCPNHSDSLFVSSTTYQDSVEKIGNYVENEIYCSERSGYQKNIYPKTTSIITNNNEFRGEELIYCSDCDLTSEFSLWCWV